MSSNQKLLSETDPALVVRTSKLRKPYRKLQLEELGDLRGLTLGASPGPTESGGGGVMAYSLKKGLPQPGDFPPPPNGFPQPGDPSLPPLP